MTETFIGCAVTGAAMLISIPLIFQHYVREHRREIFLQHLRDNALSSRAGAAEEHFDKRSSHERECISPERASPYRSGFGTIRNVS
jgi:hypothetical protein